MEAIVELFPPLKGSKIVEVGAVAEPGITDDDGMTGTEAPNGEDNDEPKCVTIEKDMEKPEEFDLSNATERKRKKLQMSKENHM